ncbi:chitobiosyldiphosphodolichol beta-mannosyltransferase [Tetranychus urticae]|uniref:Beta-1,4-mannosyltransferase n=1 Tax=Tetranychus urticae TaxID=32264 RepID=T1KW65_TETUR|nr:chitobiosyldiphosphodolichol beta-mannosyltransferase [Tetranychus urticae]
MGPSVAVVVLGDFERSPRMKYHCLSLTKSHCNVDIVAYFDTPVSEEIAANPLIKIYPLKTNSSFSSCPRIINYFMKTLVQSFSLLITLFTITKPDFVLLQNPPSVPTIPIVWFYSVIKGVNFVIDWHNYGHTILALSLGPNHLLVKIYRWCEGFFGSKSYHNFCVSQAMADDLLKTWNIEADVFYDRSPDSFKPLESRNKYNFLRKMAQMFPPFDSGDDSGSKFYEECEDGEIIEKKNRPFLLISGTSWTEDEDFSILLNALDIYDEKSCADTSLPDLICVITGKGPLKTYYQEIISDRCWTRVSVILPWLTTEDYRRMVSSADVGVSLHTSSSQLDLPMKIIDLFGCCVPVLAVSFKCLPELVIEDYNGKIFKDSKELAIMLQKLLTQPQTDLKNMRKNLLSSRKEFSWDIEWNKVVKPIFS